MRINLEAQLEALDARRDEARWVRSPEECKERIAELDKKIKRLRESIK